jgi:hypothetical protein
MADVLLIQSMYDMKIQLTLFDFEMGHGYKLIGDNQMGDMGHYINGIHPFEMTSKLNKNAKFNLNKTKKTLPNMRGYFYLVATKDIQAGEEIILDYGRGYWKAVAKWNSSLPCEVCCCQK